MHRPLNIAMILDLSGCMPNGSMILDVVKKQVMEFVRTLDVEDAFHLCGTEECFSQDRGVQVGMVGNFDGVFVHRYNQYKSSLLSLFDQDEDSRRVMIIISNNDTQIAQTCYEKLAKIPRTLLNLGEDVKFVFLSCSLQGHEVSQAYQYQKCIPQNITETLARIIEEI